MDVFEAAPGTPDTVHSNDVAYSSTLYGFSSGATPGPSPTAGSSHGGSSRIWADLVAVGVVVGIVAGVQQLTTWVRGRGLSQAQKRVLEIANSQLDAEQIHAEVKEYESRRDELKVMVEHEIPKEARRVFLENRRNQLAQRIFDDVTEYEEIAKELSIAPSSQLQLGIRRVIEESIIPSEKSRRRREGRVYALVLLLVALSLSPLSVSLLLFNSGGVIMYPRQAQDSDMAIALVLLTAVAAILVRTVYPYALRRLPWLRRLESVRYLAIFLAASIGAMVAGLLMRQRSIGDMNREYLGVSMDVTNALESKSIAWDVAAGWALFLSLLAAGLAIGMIGIRRSRKIP